MSFDELKDYLVALESEIDELLNSGATKITPQQKKKLIEALTIPLNTLKQL
jgi:hypothetical protein